MGVIRIQVRRDTAANWTANNPTLAAGEFGYETDTGKLKIGDGATAWNALGYSATSAVLSSIETYLSDDTAIVASDLKLVSDALLSDEVVLSDSVVKANSDWRAALNSDEIVHSDSIVGAESNLKLVSDALLSDEVVLSDQAIKDKSDLIVKINSDETYLSDFIIAIDGGASNTW